MATTELIQIGSFLLTSISVLVAVRIYLRNKNLEYKNLLYKTKLEAFSCIAYEMERLLNIYNNGLVQLNEFKRDSKNIKRINDFESVIEETVYEFSNKILKYSVSFPEPIVLVLYELSHSQYSAGIANIDISQAIILLENMIQKQVDKTNIAYNMMRVDLQLSKLNKDLFK